MGALPLRWRGLALPRENGTLDAATEKALAGGEWQPAFTEAALALARPEDCAAISGTGCGHLVALLAGKLGLPHLALVEPDMSRRAHLVALARLNGLPRLAFVEALDLPALRPALLFADLDGAALPRLADLPTLRAVAIETGQAPPPGRMAALFAAAEAAGLVYDTALSAGSGLVLRRA